MKRWMWILIIIVVLIAGFFGYRAYRASQQQISLSDLQTVEANSGSLTGTVGATGTVQANQTAILTFQTSGTVESISVEMGDQVSVGDRKRVHRLAGGGSDHPRREVQDDHADRHSAPVAGPPCQTVRRPAAAAAECGFHTRRCG